MIDPSAIHVLIDIGAGGFGLIGIFGLWKRYWISGVSVLVLGAGIAGLHHVTSLHPEYVALVAPPVLLVGWLAQRDQQALPDAAGQADRPSDTDVR